MRVPLEEARLEAVLRRALDEVERQIEELRSEGRE